ncbi:MAG: phospholipase [Candidatus Chlorobium antarcticum]|nr:phospholipase [Candidatus Chlorobium antarcticum]
MENEHFLTLPLTGRYLLRPSPSGAPAPLLVGFHGWGERAEDELRILSSIPGSERWTCCSVEALHPVTLRDARVGKSWMSVRQREMHIADNTRYLDSLIDEVQAKSQYDGRLVFHGFSQGASMAVRAALLGKHTARAVMMVGGDIPPEAEHLQLMGRAHLARGTRDPLYTEERYLADFHRLVDDEVEVDRSSFSGSHNPEGEYFRSAGEFLGGTAKLPAP